MVIMSLTETHDREDLQSWVETFGSTHPVGGDYDRSVWDTYDLSLGRPQYIVIDRSFVVVHASNVQATAEEFAASLL